MMKKFTILAAIMVLTVLSATSQTIMGSKPGRLELYGMLPDGTEVTAYSDALTILYNQRNMVATLPISSLRTDFESIDSLFSRINADEVICETVVPDGQYQFRSSMNEKFTSEGELTAGDAKSRLLVMFDVTNNKTNFSNTFQVICTGKISVSGNLMPEQPVKLMDEIRFRFSHNVEIKKM